MRLFFLVGSRFWRSIGGILLHRLGVCPMTGFNFCCKSQAVTQIACRRTIHKTFGQTFLAHILGVDTKLELHFVANPQLSLIILGVKQSNKMVILRLLCSFAATLQYFLMHGACKQWRHCSDSSSGLTGIAPHAGVTHPQSG